MSSALAEAQDIRERWPETLVYFPYEAPWAGAEFVGGTPMTTRATAREALKDWLDEHGAIFGPDALDYEITHSIEWQDTRTFMRFTQKIQGGDGPILAPETYGRAIAHKDGSGGWSLSFVRCAALNVPKGGLPDRQVSAQGATTIAATQSSASRGEFISEWSEPTLIVVATIGTEDPREARQVWQLYGGDPQWRTAPIGVRVDAVTGDIVAEWEAVANFAGDVSGTINGVVLDGPEPYETILPCTDYDTRTVGIPRMLVELADEPAGVAVASTYTNANGEYEFTGVTIKEDSVVRFITEHEYFQLGFVDTSSPELIDPIEVDVPSNGLVPTQTYSNNRGFGPVSDEYAVTDMTAWTVADATRLFYKIDNQTIPGIDDKDLWVIPNDEVLSSIFLPYRAAYIEASASGYTLGAPVIIFEPQRDETGVASDFPNYAYDTIISHEYGHFALDEGFGVSVDPNRGIQEGYADLLSILHHDTDLIGFAGGGCTSPTVPKHFRDWTTISLADECDSNPYIRARQLVIAWLEIRDKIGDIEDTSELFVSWSFVATPEPSGTGRECYDSLIVGSEQYDLSARDATFYEVLVADDDDGALNNGTPNDDAICAGFALINYPIAPYGPCGSAASGGHCLADFDGDGAFTAFDLAILEDWAQEGNPRADVNQDGRIDLFDRLATIEIVMACW